MLDQATPGAEPSTALHRATDGSIQVDVAGPIDLATVGVLTRALTKALDEQPTAVVVNLTDLTFLDSTGVNALMVAYRRAQAESVVFTVVNCPPIVTHVLRVLGIHDLLTGGPPT